MGSSGVTRFLAVLLLPAASGFAQGRITDFLGIQQWHGTVKITGTGSGSTSGGIFKDTWQYGLTTNLSVQLDTYNSNIQGWTGTFTGTTAISASDVSTFSGCTETQTQTFNGTLGAPQGFTLILRGTNQYAFYPAVYDVQGAVSAVSLDCAPGTQGGSGPGTFSPVLSNQMQTLPATGFSLTGSYQVKMSSSLQPQSLAFGGSPATVDVTVSWDLEPGPVVQAEVVVQKTSTLQNWRPTAGANGARGGGLDLVAKLQGQGGGTTNAKVAYWIWELTNCSKEPGYAMNAPASGPSQDFDLKLESLAEGLLIADPKGQRLQSIAGQFTQSTVTLGAYDWGAFGTIKVTAVMPDQSQIVGYLEGDPSQTEVRLPLRSANSSIADVWKQNNGTQSLADNSDNETDPQGDGNAGDGLTLYEEYRGFIIDGNHVEGNPKKKDFFVVNKAGAFYLAAFRMFQSLSGLQVHYTLKSSEMSAGRVINFNYSQGAHNVDQHGVIVVPIAADAGYAEAQGGPGPPKSITQVVTPRILPSADLTWINYLAASMAHELFHCVNVYHHGDAPSLSGTLRRDSATNTTLFQGVPANVLDENGSPFPLPLDTLVSYVIGAANDPHTGDDNCVMRYDNARAYFSKTDGNTIYVVDSEPAGLGICAQSQGTGINDASRLPQARYGDSAAGRGNCRGQILVNDGVSAPRR